MNNDGGKRKFKGKVKEENMSPCRASANRESTNSNTTAKPVSPHALNLQYLIPPLSTLFSFSVPDPTLSPRSPIHLDVRVRTGNQRTAHTLSIPTLLSSENNTYSLNLFISSTRPNSVASVSYTPGRANANKVSTNSNTTAKRCRRPESASEESRVDFRRS